MTDERTGVPTPDGADDSIIAVKRGAITFFSERSGGRPFDNCLICSAMTGLRWMGFDVPETHDDVIRKAAGVPDPQGTTLAEVEAGIGKLFSPSPTVEHLSDADFMAGLKRMGGRGRGKSVYAIIVNTGRLPIHYQRLVGETYDGLHGLAVIAKTEVPVLSVMILDPMGRSRPTKDDDPVNFESYQGELIAWADLRPAVIADEANMIKCLRFVKNAARTQ